MLGTAGRCMLSFDVVINLEHRVLTDCLSYGHITLIANIYFIGALGNSHRQCISIIKQPSNYAADCHGLYKTYLKYGFSLSVKSMKASLSRSSSSMAMASLFLFSL